MELDQLISPSAAGAALAAKRVLACNGRSARFGLVLTGRQAAALVETRVRAAQACGRVEFGAGAELGLIEAFCSSPFLCPAVWEDTLAALVELFYQFKNETLDLMPDDELIAWMAAAFNGPCQGSLELLAGRELAALVRRLRLGGKTLAAGEEQPDE